MTMRFLFFITLFTLTLVGCSSPVHQKKEEKLFVKPTVSLMHELYGKETYERMYALIQDTISKRRLHGFASNLEFVPTEIFDSVFYMNSSGDHIIGNIVFLAKGNSWDGFFPVVLRKFNNRWYINGKGSQPITSKNMTYNDVHRHIINDRTRTIYRKKPNGKLYVNQKMFEEYSDADLKKRVAKMKYPDSEKEWNYQQYFVESSINSYYRETYWQLHYLPHNYSFTYSKSKKELTITAQIPYWNDFPIDHTAVWMEKDQNKFDAWNSRIVIRMGQTYATKVINNISPNDEIEILFNMAMAHNISGIESALYRFKLTNGKVRFVKLVPHEAEFLHHFELRPQEQDSARRAWQKIIDDTFGKNYGRNAKIKSTVVA